MKSLFEGIRSKSGPDLDSFGQLIEAFPDTALNIYCELFSITGSPRLNGFALFNLDRDRLSYLVQGIYEIHPSGEDELDAPVPMRFRSETSLYIDDPIIRFTNVSKGLPRVVLQLRGFALDSDGTEYELVSHYFKLADILSDALACNGKREYEIFARPDMSDDYAGRNASMLLERAKRTVYPEDYRKSRTPGLFG